MSVHALTPSSRRAFLARLDPLLVLRLITDDLGTGKELVQYETLYRELRDAYLKEHGDTTVTIASLLKRLDNCLVETAYRDAGFIVGFEVCRHLLLGEIDLEALQRTDDEPEGGAR
jgi:hypothetical protein